MIIINENIFHSLTVYKQCWAKFKNRHNRNIADNILKMQTNIASLTIKGLNGIPSKAYKNHLNSNGSEISASRFG